MLTWKLVLGVALGAAAGFAWYRLVGCRSGTCIITARWWTASLYGAIMGYMVAR